VRELAGKIAAECLAGRSRVLSRALTAISDRALSPIGLKTSQFNLLVVVSLEDRPAKICAGLQMEESTLSRNVERMQRRGWVQFSAGPDRRSHLIKITAKGRKLLKRAYPIWLEVQREIGRRLGAEGTAALKRITATFIE